MPVFEKVPTEHAVQVVAPVVAITVPGVQVTHVSDGTVE